MIEAFLGNIISTSDWTPEDGNQDGHLNGPDIPFEPGSLAAKKAWVKIEADAHSLSNIQKCKALGYDNGRGMYQGKPLVPGAGPGQGDFDLLRDRLIFSQGYSPEVADKIAANAKWMAGK